MPPPDWGTGAVRPLPPSRSCASSCPAAGLGELGLDKSGVGVTVETVILLSSVVVRVCCSLLFSSRGPALEPPRNKTSGAAGVVGRTRPSTQRTNNTQHRALCGENATQFRIRTMFIKMWNLCDFAHWLEGRPSKDCGSSKGFVAEPSSLSRRG